MKVYFKGDASTPFRFYKYLLCKNIEDEKRAIYLGFIYSKVDTEEYLALSKEKRDKISFYDIPKWQVDRYEQVKPNL